jgi:hypothetical protein
MDHTFELDNKELSLDLLSLCIMCAEQDTNACDITISAQKHRVKCHLEFDIMDKENTDENTT